MNRPRLSMLVISHTRRWLPMAVLAVFSIGAAASLFVAHGQDSAAITNAVHIAELQHDLADIKDMPIQFGVLRERVVKIEAKLETVSKTVDSIETKGDWLVFGVFGLLISGVVKGIRFDKTERIESNDRIPLIKP